MTEEKKQTPHNTIAWIGGGAITLFDAIQALISIADRFGVPLDGAFLWMADNSWWLFPLGVLLLGIFIGWQLKKWYMTKQDITAERIHELEEELKTKNARLAELENDESDVERFRILPQNLKTIVGLVERNDYLDDESHWLAQLEDNRLIDMCLDEDGEDFEWLISSEVIPCGHRLRLTKAAKDLLSRHHDLIEPTYEEIDNGNICLVNKFSVIDGHKIAFDKKKRFEYYNRMATIDKAFRAERDGILYDLVKEAKGDRDHIFIKPVDSVAILLREDLLSAYVEDPLEDQCRFRLNERAYWIAESLME